MQILSSRVLGKCVSFTIEPNMVFYHTPICEIKDPCNITKLIHRPEEGLNFKSECILVSAMVHLPQE